MVVLFTTTFDFDLLALAVGGRAVSLLVDYKSRLPTLVVQNHFVFFELNDRNFVIKGEAVWII